MGSPPIRHHLARHDGRRGLHRTSAAAPPVRHDGRHDDQPSTYIDTIYTHRLREELIAHHEERVDGLVDAGDERVAV